MLPKVSIVVFAQNEEKLLPLCLKSIFAQDYPPEKLEVIFVDDFSTDKTAEIAKSHPVIYYKKNSGGDPEVNKLFGLRRTTGELVMYLDADIHLRGKDWLKKMICPFIENKQVANSFTSYYSDKHSSLIEKYLNLDPLQRDVVYQFFSPSPDATITTKHSGYSLCDLSSKKIAPQGLSLHKRELIKDHFKKKRFLELDVLVDLVERGHKLFAYVPSAGMYHHHADNLLHLLKKRMRNVNSVYLVDNEKRKYRWFDTKTVNGLLKIVIWLLIAITLFPLVIYGIYRTVKHRSLLGLLDPVVGPLVTLAILFAFLSDKRTRKLLFPRP